MQPHLIAFEQDIDGTMLSTIVEVPHGSVLSEFIDVSTLCYHARLGGGGRCGVCAVDIWNDDQQQWHWKLACQVRVVADLKVRKARNGLAWNIRHNGVTRAKNVVASATTPMGGGEIEDLLRADSVAAVRTSTSLHYDPAQCVGCSRCVRACDQLQGMRVLRVDGMTPTTTPTPNLTTPCMELNGGVATFDKSACISCGQCTVFCPTGAISERSHVQSVVAALDKNKSGGGSIVVLQVAPSVRITLAEFFGGEPGAVSAAQLVHAAHLAGFGAVFDTNFCADLTIMEESAELIQRLTAPSKSAPLPMFTSCCPAWVNLVEKHYPQYLPNLSSCRSPGAMMSSLIHHVWAPSKGYKDVFVVQLMPCVAKKDEAARPQLNGETNAVLTVREFGHLLRLRGVVAGGGARRPPPHNVQARALQQLVDLSPMDFDDPLGEGSGAAVLFGVTGGVMEAALRTAAETIFGGRLEHIDYEMVRGLEGVRRSRLLLSRPGAEPVPVSVAVVNGTRSTRELLARIESGSEEWRFDFGKGGKCSPPSSY